MESNNPTVYMGWNKIAFIEREDTSKKITFEKNILSFAKGRFLDYVDEVNEIRSGVSYDQTQQEFLINGSKIFVVTLGIYGNVTYLCEYSKRQEEEKEFGHQMFELSNWAKVPWHIAKIAKGMSMVDGYEVLCSIKKVANSSSLNSMEQDFLMKRDLKLRLDILEGLFPKRIWARIKEAVTRSEINSRYLAFYIMTKGEVDSDINVYCTLPKAFYPTSITDIFHYNMNIRAMKSGVGINFALCTSDIEDNYEAILLLKHMRNVISSTNTNKKENWIFCSEDDYYRNSMIRHHLGEEIWAAIGNTVLKKTACSLAIGHYIYCNHPIGKKL